MIAVTQLLNLCGTCTNWWQETHGSINVTVNSQMVNNNGNHIIVVCVENSSQNGLIDLSNISIVPNFYNPTDYKLNNFNLTYDVNTVNVKLDNTDFFEAKRAGLNKIIYQYKEKELDSDNTEVPSPFICAYFNGDQGRCEIKAKVNYKGADEKFEYNMDVWFFSVSNRQSEYYEDWKKNYDNFVSNIDGMSCYDEIYVKDGKMIQFRKDIPLPAPKTTKTTPLKDSVRTELKLNDVLPNNISKGNESAEIKVDKYSVSLSDNENYPYKVEFHFSTPVKESGEYLFTYDYLRVDSVSDEVKGRFVQSLAEGASSTNMNYRNFAKFSNINVYPKGKREDFVSSDTTDHVINITNNSNYVIVLLIEYENKSFYLKELAKGESVWVDKEKKFDYFVFKTNKKSTIAFQFLLFLIISSLFAIIYLLGYIKDDYDQMREFLKTNRKNALKYTLEKFKWRNLKERNKRVSKFNALFNTVRLVIAYLCIIIIITTLISCPFIGGKFWLAELYLIGLILFFLTMLLFL